MAITTRAEDYSARYNDLVQQAELAENSSVRGCMVIKPYGYAIWENIRDVLDQMFKNTWHQNAYFPLFIPKSFLCKEADHVQWFAKECAVVTHYRLKNAEDWSGVVVDPEARLEEELIVRPTSETIIWDSYKKWISSYRDLPLLLNQWANVVRWEMRTRIFLRSAEFLRQEWHTAHATSEEANEEAKKMIDVYRDFSESYLATSPVVWRKPAHERFAGALETYTIEPMMQDLKSLQAGTSHFLGQNFGKAFDVQFTNENNELEYVWWTSWGVSTRLMWNLIMAHSDDQGLVLPPALAPIHLVIVPIFKTAEDLEEIKSFLKDVYYGTVCEDWSEQDFRKYINEMYDKFLKLDINQISLWKGWSTDKASTGFLKMVKGAGAIATACHAYNQLLAKLKIGKKYDEIKVGDYVRFCYISKNNPYWIEYIAFPDGQWPKEFQSLFSIDYETMFEKLIMKPLERFLEATHFQNVDPRERELCSLDDL